MNLKRTLLPLLLLLVLFAVALAGPIKDGSLSGASNGSGIFLRWMSEDEAGVARIEVQRAAGVNGLFFTIHEMAPKGGNQAYDYFDDSAFRVTGSVYRYQIKAVFRDGSAVQCAPITVRHDVSSVRRTWGSIKAMFR
jgi:hypothetical protein